MSDRDDEQVLTVHESDRPRRRERVRATPSENMILDALREYFPTDAQALRFARAFASCVLAIPEPSVIESAARRLRVVAALIAEPTTEVIRRLADHHDTTPKEIARRFHRGAGTSVSGQGSAKLSLQQVTEIKRRLREGHKGLDIARDFGVTPGTISAIRVGRAWKGV